MVRTRSATKTIKTLSNDGRDTTVEISPGHRPVASSPAKKRQRHDVAAPNLKRRRRGKPGELCQLNLDVLFLIAAYIHPLDLLNLARMCKSLRILLMDKSSAFVWKSARRQVKGLPDCPADLTEPEYANLVFYARCHGCGKHTKTVFWQMRRRYCPDCRAGRLCPLYSCHDIIRDNAVLALTQLTVERGITIMVDKEQMDSFMEEYKRSPDQQKFLNDRREQLSDIRRHAHACEWWQRDRAAERQEDLRMRRQERTTSIFERLKQLGYEPEIMRYGRYEIQGTRTSLFRTSKPLTDKEWDRIWPEWIETMNAFRSRRLETVVYHSRRFSLASQYASYVSNPSSNTPSFELFPHVADIARFPPFRDIIRADEGALMPSPLFESVFSLFPALIDDWRKKLDAELAELVKIPSHLMAPNSGTEPCRADADKLHLACALFHGSFDGVFAHPEVFATVMRRHSYPHYLEDDLERTGSVCDRFGIEFMEEAPYIVHACGLDPYVATVEDMDRRNARIKCLSCQNTRVWSWRDALWHARSSHRTGRALLCEFPRWQIASDQYTVATHTAELFVGEESPQWVRCLLCRPHVGDAFPLQRAVMNHLKYCHHIEEDNIKRGEHWRPLGMYGVHPVEMAESTGEEGPRYNVLQ